MVDVKHFNFLMLIFHFHNPFDTPKILGHQFSVENPHLKACYDTSKTLRNAKTYSMKILLNRVDVHEHSS